MANTSKIEWTGRTWNPIVGCSMVSEGCRHCYAVRIANRQQAMGARGYNDTVIKAANGTLQWAGNVNFVESALYKPLKRKKETLWFVNSMSDLFHPEVTFQTIANVFYIMAITPQHTYQVLTKRPARMLEFFDWLCFNPQALTIPEPISTLKNNDIKEVQIPLPNVWLGVTVENNEAKQRIELLKKVPSVIRFLSCEPLLEKIEQPNLSEIDWVIIGGESGPQARPMQKEWAEALINDARAANARIFFKQWGTWGEDGVKRSKKKNGRLLDGMTWNETPEMCNTPRV